MDILKIIGRILLVIILIVILLALFGYLGTYLQSLKYSIVGDSTQTPSSYTTMTTTNTGQPTTAPSVTIGNTVIPVEIARDYASIQKGLSGRAYLDQNSGMLFMFPKASIYRFWMPDMYFSIDLFWINNDQVVGIEENMSNDFDPAHPRYYSPTVPVQFVVEVNAGFARRHNIRINDRVIFNNIR
ncbi:DUF192 domain-containing protein [Patescibacteria group bacterium]|nr:MAG: DUF192 domain-containing protein [Patescibacteria group bacterium]